MKRNEIKNTLFNIVLTVGIVIGVGIFFKNNSIIAAAHGNPGIIISAWIIGGVISISSALAFSLLNMKSGDNDNNVSEFVKMSYGKKIGKKVKWSFMFIYYPIYLYVISIFTTKQLFDLFGYQNINNLYPFILFLVSTFLVLIFITFTYLAPKISKYTQISSTVIKLIPFILLTVIVIGGIFMENPHSYWHSNGQTNLANGQFKGSYNQTTGMNDIGIIFWIIPAVKFAFDGFISVTGNKRATSVRSISIGITIGMTIVTIFYIITTIALLQEGVTNVPDALVSFFGGDINNLSSGYLIIKKTIIAIIVISGLGSLNGMAIIWKRMVVQTVDDEKKNAKKNSIFLLISSFLFATIPWLILSLILKDQVEVFDVVSDAALLVGFVINALILVKILYMQKKKEIKLSKIFIIFSLIAIIGIGATAGWKIVDGLIISQIKHGGELGIFGWPKWTYILVFSTVVIQFILAHKVGEFIINRMTKK